MTTKTTLVFAVVVGLFIIGCASQQHIPALVASPPVFNYAPPTNAEARSAKVVLAFFKPVYGANSSYPRLKVHYDFMQKFPDDFEELLLAKGFSIRGPFQNFDDITYGDKSESHLLITPTLNILVDERNAKYETKQKYTYPNGNITLGRCTGSVTLRCTITLTARESLTRELLWKKTVDLSEILIPISGEKFYSNYSQIGCYNSSDVGISNSVARGLEKLYSSALNKCWDLIDSRELEALLPAVETIREKKVH